MKSEMPRENDRRFEALSAIGDGQADGDELRTSCEAWADSADMRQQWHAYNLIGDVLRSGEPPRLSTRHADFLSALRVRLADEPLPTAKPARVQSGLAGWLAGGWAGRFGGVAGNHGFGMAAVAAGVLAVVGAVTVMRPADTAGMAPIVAQAVPVDTLGAASAPMLRNPDLDRYLSAHRQFAQGPALAAPGGVRQVAVTPDGR